MTPEDKAELQDRITHEGYEYALFEWGGWDNPKCDTYIKDMAFQHLFSNVLAAKAQLKEYLERIGIDTDH
jgi:hypothetical protein